MAEILHIYEEAEEPYDEFQALADEREELYEAQKDFEEARQRFYQEQGRQYLQQDGIYEEETEEEEYYVDAEDYISQRSIGIASLVGVFGTAFIGILGLAILGGAATLSPAAILGFVGTALLAACLVFFLLNFLPWHEFLNIHAPHVPGLWASAFLGAAVTLCLVAMTFGIFSLFAGDSKSLLDYFKAADARQTVQSSQKLTRQQPPAPGTTSFRAQTAPATNSSADRARSSRIAKQSTSLLTVKHKTPGISPYLQERKTAEQPAPGIKVKPSDNENAFSVLDEGERLTPPPTPIEKPAARPKKKITRNQNDPILKKSRATIKEVDQLMKESSEMLSDIEVIY